MRLTRMQGTGPELDRDPERLAFHPPEAHSMSALEGPRTGDGTSHGEAAGTASGPARGASNEALYRADLHAILDAGRERQRGRFQCVLKRMRDEFVDSARRHLA